MCQTRKVVKRMRGYTYAARTPQQRKTPCFPTACPPGVAGGRSSLVVKTGKWIGHGGPVAWSPHFPGLNALDFFFWGHLKSLVYETQWRISGHESLSLPLTSPAHQICFNVPVVVGRKVLRHGPTGPGPRASSAVGVSFCSRLCLNKIMIRCERLTPEVFPHRLAYLMACQVIYSQFGLAIHQNDHHARRRFVEWAHNKIAVVPDFHKRILFSDEAHFWLNGYVNKQNCRIWSEANPQVYVETPLHPEKLTVWCALWAGGILLQKR
ncbi:hypothetical protein TNCV_3660641 [Trichonephila clavipes]|nr:hypothetical protein TNCV_3660641 [Trichonephila clavipes]